MEETELNRQTNYIIAISSPTDLFAIENTVEEAEAYIQMFPERKAIIVSENYRNDNMAKIAYDQVQTFSRGELRIVDKRDNTNHDEVIKIASMYLKNGLMVIHNMKPTNELIEKLINRNGKGQDIIIHRNKMAFYPAELQFINSVIDSMNVKFEAGNQPIVPAKNVILRLHADDSFKFNRDTLMQLVDIYGQDVGYSLFLCQFVLVKKKIEYKKILEAECEKQEERFENFIDPFFFKKESSNFVYFNTVTKEILGADPVFLEECNNEIVKHFTGK